VVAKKKSRAELALSVISTRKRRTLSTVTVSGDRPRNLANIACLADIVLLGLSAELADRHVVQHAAPNVTDARFADWGVLAVEVENPSILKTEHSPVISFPVDLYLSPRTAPARSALPR
jgi:hypothetical protein